MPWIPCKFKAIPKHELIKMYISFIAMYVGIYVYLCIYIYLLYVCEDREKI